MHGPDNQNKMDDFLMRSTNHNFLQWKAPLILSCFIVTLPILLSRLEFKVRKADFLLAAPERFFSFLSGAFTVNATASVGAASHVCP